MSSHRPTRRHFLQSRPITRGLSDAMRAASEPQGPRNDPPGGKSSTLSPLDVERNMLLVSVRRRAMACEWEVQLAANREDDSMEHIFAALDLVEALEAQMTVYRADSEVIRINRQAASAPMRVERRLFGLLQLAARICSETDRALDITSGPLSDVWGFSRRQGRLPSDAELAAALEQVNMSQVVLDQTRETISFLRPGISINFNSVGKGYALDRMEELLAEGNVNDYLLHGGKSSVLARGNRPGNDADGWTIGLRHPLRPAERIAELRLCDQALSTSGSGTQYFIRQGKRFGHILDPRTGRPAEGVYSATVIAPTAAEAEALSTAFYVMGPEKVAAYCADRPHLSAVLVCPAHREGDIRVLAFGMEESQPPEAIRQ